MFADLAGFTALTEAHGDPAAADLAMRFSRAVTELLPADADYVKSIGDAVLLRVGDAADALRLALRVVSEVGGRPEFPVVRIGMHSGTAVRRGGDWFGAAVNLAARVAGAARGGEVLLSEVTRRAIGALDGVEFQSRGVHRLRNVGADIRLYAATEQGSTGHVLPIDPVCRMAVDPAGSRRLTYEGFELHFCSERCLAIFQADPERHMDVRHPAP